ncbi:hypothetical protein [Kaarinaea lacus]
MTTASITAPNPMRSGHLIVSLILLTWFSVITLLSVNGFFLTAPGEPPAYLLLTGLISLITFAVSYIAIPKVREYVLALDMRMLILLHSWRMLGMGFVMLYVVDQLPLSFAFFAGFGDALTAIGAMILGYTMLSQTKNVSHKWVLRWNTFGLLDFIVAVSIGVLTRQGAMLEPASGLNSDLMAQFPFVLIPAFLVQVFTLTHIIIYLQLRNNKGSSVS